jgi:DNA polymerase-3 subunit epsilon
MTLRCVLDTETTGMKAGKPDRIVEIACVEMDDTLITGNEYQTYVNPRVRVNPYALRIHGLTDGFLSDKPEFEDVYAELIEFIGDRELIIHNSDFDLAFLNFELEMIGLPPLKNTVVDTLKLARRMRPGRRNSIDALVVEYKIKTHRVDGVHGALADCRDLARVYAAMMQAQGNHPLDFDVHPSAETVQELPQGLKITYATPAELAAHAAMCSQLGIKVWTGVK